MDPPNKDNSPKRMKMDVRPERHRQEVPAGQGQEQALDIVFPNVPVEDPNAPAPSPSSFPCREASSGPKASPAPVQIANMEMDVALHRQLVAQAELNAARVIL